MSACFVMGCAQGGITVLSCTVNDALSQGDACDQLRQAEPLETLILSCKPSTSLVEGRRDDEVEALQAFIEAPWMLLQAALGMGSHEALKVVLELPQPTTVLTKSVGAFWSCWLESANLSSDFTQTEVELRFIDGSSVSAS